MKGFYGRISLTASLSFVLEAEDKDKAINTVFEDIEGLEIRLKDGSSLQIVEIEWDLIEKSRRGNVAQPYVHDFDIQEE